MVLDHALEKCHVGVVVITVGLAADAVPARDEDQGQPHQRHHPHQAIKEGCDGQDNTGLVLGLGPGLNADLA